MSDPTEQRSERTPRPVGDDEAVRRAGRGGTVPLSPEDVTVTTTPDWRQRAGATRPAGRRQAGALPSSPQELQLWLQKGGWRLVAGAAAFFIVLLIAMLAFSRNDTREQGFPDSRSPSAEAGVGQAPLLVEPTITPIILPTQPPASGRFYTVINTGGQGLFLRADHSTDAEILTTLPDGTRLEQIGPEFTGADRLWRNVRAPDGREGWVAADFLQESP